MTTNETIRPATFELAWSHAQEAEGWLTRDQGLALFEAARSVEPGTWIVEIGSHCGRSTVLLAAAKQPSVRLLAVDPFDDPRWGGGPEALAGFEHTLRQAALLDEVQMFRGLSAEAADARVAQPVALLFVDGAHDRASVLTDIDGWARHLSDGAVLMFHDAYSSPGVTIAIFERYLLSKRARYRGSVGSLARVDLDRERGLGGGLRHVGGMLSRLPWFVRNVLIKVALRREWPALHRVLGHPGKHHPY